MTLKGVRAARASTGSAGARAGSSWFRPGLHSIWDKSVKMGMMPPTLLGGTSQVALVIKNLPAMEEMQGLGFNPWVRQIPWRRAGQPTPVFLLGESRGQRSLVGYSPWGHRVGHD